MKMLDFVGLEEKCKNNLAELLCNVDNRDFVWLDEILEEAKKIFKSNFDGEPELMPKTPSQKNRRKKKRISTTKNNPFSEKSFLSHSTCRMTRSQTARISNATCKTATVDLARGRIPLVEIHNHERLSAELHLEKTAAQKTKKADLANKLSLDGEVYTETLQPLSKASLLVIPDTPETQIKKDRSACKLKIANLAVFKTTETGKPSPQAEELLAQPQDKSQDSETKLACNLHERSQTCSQTCSAKKANRQSVRRSLMGKTSMNEASLAQRCSLANKRERAIQKSGKRTMSMRSTTREQSSTGRRVSCRVSLVKLVAEEIAESRPQLDSASHSQEVADQPFSPSHQVSRAAAVEEQHEGTSKENSSEKNAEVQDQPQSIRRKASYKRAVNELCDGQHTEDELSPPRKKSPSPQCPASKVVRPLKTFLHTVHKNRVLMMTPGSVSQNSAMKSFLKYNTPLPTNFKEKKRQRLENLKKKQEAEEQRKQKMEEEKRRRLEEIKRKREEHLRKVLQARERVEQREEEKKKLLEQKFAQNEKVREEKMAEEKVKRAAAAKKAEALEARKRRALQLEERRQQELMQRIKEEELEKARQIAELGKKLAAERELEKQREQEKLRAQQELERKEKKEAARLQRELMAAKKEQLLKEAEEKERKRQEEEQKQKSTSDAVAGHEQLNATIQIKSSTSCNSYPMTPQGPKQPKFDGNNYGMDLNSDDSTDDESHPRKPIPAWATGNQLSEAIIHQYYNPPDIDAFFGVIRSPKLEEIFCKSKPRYQKRTSSAVWNSPPFPYGKSMTGQSWEGLKRC